MFSTLIKHGVFDQSKHAWSYLYYNLNYELVRYGNLLKDVQQDLKVDIFRLVVSFIPDHISVSYQQMLVVLCHTNTMWHDETY